MTAGDIIALCGLGLGCIGGFLALLRYFTQMIAQEQTWREEADDIERLARERHSAEDQAIHLQGLRDLADYKLHVANTYVSVSNMREVEERLTTAMDRIAARLETIVTRLERISVDVATVGVGRRAAKPVES